MSRAPAAAEYRLLVQHSPVMIWRSGLDAKCDYFNETWLAFTGRTLEQEMGDGWAEGVHPEDFDRCVACYLDHFGRRQPFEMEYRLRRHDGEFRWIFDRGVPFTDDRGEFAGFIGSCVDVDDRRRAAEAREHESEEQLAMAREFEKSILAIVSHDIRNPLGNMLFAAHGLQHLSEPGSAVRKNADVVMRGVKRIEHIIGDLLDLSREREGEGIKLAPKSADLADLCREAIEELQGVARGREIRLHCEADVRGVWDSGRVMQAISNLASNAVQHGTPGSPIRITLTGDDRRVVVEVRNQGVIPPDILPRIFEPFRSGSHQGKRGEGLGLGLFIAKAIARAHGGDLEVESAEGATVFRLVLPREAWCREWESNPHGVATAGF